MTTAALSANLKALQGVLTSMGHADLAEMISQ